MKKILIGLIIISIFILSGCIEKPQVSSSSYIKIELSAHDPVFPKLVIDNNGTVMYSMLTRPPEEDLKSFYESVKEKNDMLLRKFGTTLKIPQEEKDKITQTKEEFFEKYRQYNYSQVSRQELENLANFIIDNEFFSLKDEYINRDVVDAVSITIKVTIDDKTKSVVCNWDCPTKFNKIKNKIVETWGGDFEIVGWA